MNVYIITGTSKGLGESIAEDLLQEGNYLFCISRKRNEQLIREADKKEVPLDYIEFDLNNPDGIDNLMERVFHKLDPNHVEFISLINNAGVVEPIKPIGKASMDQITQNIHVNLLAPMLIVSSFIRYTEKLSIEKRVINISSGAANRPVFGWGSYCTSKAGLDMFTQTVALEQQQQKFPVKIMSFAPGIIDTEMQQIIRSSDETDFADVNQFIGYKEEGALLSVKTVSEAVIKLVHSPTFESGAITHIREVLNNL